MVQIVRFHHPPDVWGYGKLDTRSGTERVVARVVLDALWPPLPPKAAFSLVRSSPTCVEKSV